MPAPIDILAFAPHPDDAEIGCGGLLLLAARDGLRTAVVDLSEGEGSTHGTPVVRAAERDEATRRLGLAHREGLGLPDTRIGQSPEHEARIVAVIRRLRPRLVLAPYLVDRHPDHEATARLVQRAAFFARVAHVGESPTHRVERLLCYAIHRPFEPTVIVDVTPVWQSYQGVLRAYQSQFCQPAAEGGSSLSDGSFLRALESRAAYLGSLIGRRYGEAYHSAAPLCIESPAALLGATGGDGYNAFS